MVDIKREADAIYPEVVSWRRDIHAHPELSHKEERTAKKVAEILRGLGLEVAENIGGDHGVVALLRGAKPGKTLGLRADMDALPVEEATGLDFASTKPGVMHACGHDGHTATLLGAATILAKMRDELAGNVKFIFQPAEESIGSSGAEIMVKAGVLENPKVDAIMMAHIFPYAPAGTVQTTYGPMCAAADSVAITVRGLGGHGSQPSKAVDALLVACQIVDALQGAVTRHVDVFDPAVLTIGSLHAGTAANIIADSARLEGSVRTYSAEAQELIERAVRDIAEGAAKMSGATAEVAYTRLIPAVVNDPKMAELAKSAIDRELPGMLQILDRPVMGSEDFSFYLKAGVPGVMLALGGGQAGVQPYPNHNPHFAWGEEAMRAGMVAFAASAREFLM
jgi:amidohydrolase